MGLTGCGAVTKWILVIFNSIFFILGIGVLGVGIWLKLEREDYEDISSYDFVTPSNIAIAIGVIVMVVSFVGCVGAATENSCFLLLHFLLLFLIFVLQIIACVLAYVNRGKVEDGLESDFRKSIKEKYGEPEYEAVTKVIDKFQNEFKCCGFSSYKDWRMSKYNKRTASIPKSCCIESQKESKLCGSPNPSGLLVYEKKGCYNEVLDFLKENLLVVGAFALAMAIVQVFGLIFAIYLYILVVRANKGTFA